MKVWVALGGWDHEGYSLPIGVYTSPELAFDALKLGYDAYQEKIVVEYELDELKTWPEQPSQIVITPPKPGNQ